jgi:hypothetical protein
MITTLYKKEPINCCFFQKKVAQKLYSILFCVLAFLMFHNNSYAQPTVADGDYRTLKTGNWTATDVWQVRSSGTWAATSTPPSASNNVWIQTGHIVTLTADAACNTLLIAAVSGATAVSGQLNISSNTFSCNNSPALYSQTAAVTSSSDGAMAIAYVTYGASSSTYPITSSTSSGVFKFVGSANRTIVSNGWNVNGIINTTVQFEFGSNICTLGNQFRARNIIVASGTLSASSRVGLGIGTTASTSHGDFTVKSGARFISSATGSTAGTQVLTRSNTSVINSLTVESGGTLELTGAAPSIDATSITLSGTVVYSLSTATQTLVKPSGVATSGTGATIGLYNNLTLSGLSSSFSKNLSANTTVNGTLSIQGATTATPITLSGSTLTYGTNAILEYAGSTAQTATAIEWPLTSGPANITVNNSGGLTIPFDRTISGTLTLTNGVVTNSVTTNAGVLTLSDGATISRTQNGRLTVAPIFGTTTGVNIIYTGSNAIETSGRFEQTPSSGRIRNITVNLTGGALLNTVSSPALAIFGNLTVNSGGGILLNNTLSVAGNISFASGTTLTHNNNTITVNGTSNTQTITSNGVALYNLTVNNTHTTPTVTLNDALTISNQLTLTAGRVITSSSNLLTITNTATSAIAGTPSASAYIEGPIARTLPASLASGSTYLFPVGKSGAYYPFELVNPTTTPSASLAVVRAEVFSASAGAIGSGVAVNTNRYWQATVTANSSSLSNTSVRLTDAAYGSAALVINGSTLSSSGYVSIGGNSVNSPSNTITSDLVNTFNQFFVLGRVSNVPQITSSLTAASTLNNGATSYSIIASNTPTSYDATGLPAGLSINSNTGVISGTPTTTGTFTVTISATNGDGTDTKSLSYTINNPYFYYGGSGALDNYLNWYTDVVGGTQRAQATVATIFTDNNTTFEIRDNVSTSANSGTWSITGTGSKIILGNSAVAAVTLTVTSGKAISGTIDVASASSGSNTLIWQDAATAPVLGTINTASTVTYSASTAQSITTATYGNLVIGNTSATGASTIASSTVTVNNLTVNSGATLSLGAATTTSISVTTAATINGKVIFPATVTTFIGGAGSFTLNSTGSLQIGSTNGIANSTSSGNLRVSGTRTLSGAATYVYSADGSSTIQVTGSSLPTTITGAIIINTPGVGTRLNSGLVINSPGSVTVSANAKFSFFTVVSGATVNYELTGSGSFITNNNSTLGIGTVSGLNRSGTASGPIQLTGTRTFDAATNYEFAGTSSQPLGAEFGNLITSCNNLIINNTTVSGTVTLSSTNNLTVNGSLQLNNVATLVVNGTLTLNGTIATTTGNGGINASAGSLVFSGSGANQNIPANIFAAALNNVTINNANGVTINSNVTINGALSLQSGSFNVNGNTCTLAGTVTTSGGNIATATSGSTIVAALDNLTSGIFVSNSVNNLTINKVSGVTNAGPLAVSGILTLSSGLFTTSNSALLTVSNTSASAISGASSSTYVNGPMAITLPASLTSGSTYLLPIGKAGSYFPMELVNPTTTASASLAVVRAEVFNAGSGGSGSAVVLNTNRYWTASLTANATSFINTQIRLTDAAYGDASLIAQSSSLAGSSYASIGGNSVNAPANTITSNTISSFSQFLALADVLTFKPSITSSTATVNTTANFAYSYAISATNNPTSYAATGLPSGLSINTNTGTISGTPTVAGSFPITISATNSDGTGNAIFTLNLVLPYYYYDGVGALDDYTNWYSGVGATGTQAYSSAIFTQGKSTFDIRSTVSTASNSGTWTVSGTGSKIIFGNSGTGALTLTIASGKPIVGTIDVNAPSSGTNTVTMADATTPTWGTLDATSTIIYNGSSSTAQTIAAATYGNLTVNGGSGVSRTVAGNISVNGILTIASGTILEMGTNQLSGTITSTSGTGTIRTQNTSSTPIPAGESWTGSIEFNGAAAQTLPTATFAATSTLTISNNTTLTNGSTLTSNGATFTIGSGKILTINGIFTSQTATPTYNYGDATSSINFGATGVYNNNINLGAYPRGTWNINSTVNNTGSISTTSSPSISQTFGNFNWNCPSQTSTFLMGNTNSGSVFSVAGTLTIASTGTGSVNIPNSNLTTVTVGNLIISGSSNVSIAGTGATGDRTLIVNGNLTMSGTSTLLINGTSSRIGTLTVGGNFTHSGGTISQSAGTANLVFNGTSSQSFATTGLTGIVNVNINNPTSVTLNSAITMPASSTLTLTSGSFNNGSNLTFAASATINRVAGSLTSVPTFGSSINVSYSGTGTITRGNEMPSSSSVLNNLTIGSGSTLDLNGQSLTINGNLSGTGFLRGSATTSISITGSGTLNMDQSTPVTSTTLTGRTNVLNNLTVNGGTLTLGNALHLIGTLTKTTGTLASGGNLNLKSTATTQAVVAPITSGSITGNVVVERYIPKGKRAFRDIAPGVTPSTSVFNSWQEGGAFTSGYGTYITGLAATKTFAEAKSAIGFVDGTTGFDLTASGSKSMFTYDNSTGSWDAGVTNTKSLTLNAYRGYRLIIRGDRSWSMYLVPQAANMINATTLRSTGTLLTGNQSGFTLNADATGTGSNSKGFSLVGNPYVSPIDWNAIVDAGRATNLSSTIWFLNPKTVGYVTYNKATGQTAPSGNNYGRYIQPGQGFFVRTTAASPSLTITEADKEVTQTADVFGSEATSAQQVLRIGLYKPVEGITTSLVDETVAVFGNFSNAVNGDDSYKMENSAYNIALLNNGNKLAIEARSAVSANDVLPVSLNKLSNGTNYQLKVDASGYNSNGFDVYVKDAYKQTETLVKVGGESVVDFTIDNAVSASYNNRFSLVFKPSVLPISSIDVQGVQQGNDVVLSINTVGESNIGTYSVEKSTDGVAYSAIAVLSAKNTASASYSVTDSKAVSGNNYYRVKVNGLNEASTYSKVVIVKVGGSAAKYALYPNPSNGSQVGVQLTGVSAGKYTVTLRNMLGQEVHRAVVAHVGGNGQLSIKLASKLSSGSYTVSVLGATATPLYQGKLVVE